MKHIEDISIGALLIKAQLGGNIQSYITIATDGEKVFCTGNGQHEYLPVLILAGIIALYDEPKEREKVAVRLLRCIRWINNEDADEKGKEDAH